MTDRYQALRDAIAAGPHARHADRFLEKIDFTDSCWLWKASTSGHPGRRYGNFWVGRPIKAHQFSYEAFRGPRTPGRLICHTCDNGLCVNPGHLYEGTHKDNVRDAVERGRHSNGQSSKTHCPQGHPYVPSNVFEERKRNGKIYRQCRTCRDVHRGRTPNVYF